MGLQRITDPMNGLVYATKKCRFLKCVWSGGFQARGMVGSVSLAAARRMAWRRVVTARAVR